MTILTGCSRTSAKTVLADSFCSGKYEPQTDLTQKDFNNFKEIRKTESHRITLDKLLDNLAINEKEFKQCPKIEN